MAGSNVSSSTSPGRTASASTPSPRAAVLGIDIGRSGLELVVLAGDGEVLATHRRAYPGDHAPDRPGDPSDWWRAVRTGTKDILRRAGLDATSVRAVGLTGEHACVAVDRNGEVLADAVLGCDRRDQTGLDALLTAVGARTLANLTGGPADLSCAAVQLLALREREKRAWHDLRHLLSPKDFIRLRLCSTVGTDPSDASASLLYNPRTRAWSKQLMTLLGLDPAILPTVGTSHTLGGRITDTAAREAGLISGTPVVTGATRLASMAIAAGATEPGAVILELGGLGGLLVTTSEALRDPEGRFSTGCAATNGLATLVAHDRTGGAATDWVLETVLTELSAQARRQGRDPLLALAETAADAPAGADGLRWRQERGGGQLIGLQPQHSRAHVARAAIEGGVLAARSLLQRLELLKVPTDRIYIGGSGAAAPLWCQVAADVLGRDVRAITIPESAALGAAVLAAGAVGLHKKSTVAKSPPWLQTWSPRKAAVVHYAETALEAHA